MRCLLLIFLGIATTAKALDVCSAYSRIHEREIIPRIKSGIPFQLLSVAADGHESFRRIVRIDYDLWNETLGVEVIGRQRETCVVKDAIVMICRALSFPEASAGHKYQYRLLLNPVLGEGLRRLREHGDSRSGLLEINWDRLAKDLDTEKTLVESELSQ